MEESFSGSGPKAAAYLPARSQSTCGRGVCSDGYVRTRKGLAPEAPDDTDRLAELGQCALETAARAVANLAIAFDPEVVALSGGMLRSEALIVPELRSALDRLVPFPPRLVMAHFAELAPLAGACLLAYQAAGVTEPDRLQLGGSPVGAVPSTSQEEPADRGCEEERRGP